MHETTCWELRKRARYALKNKYWYAVGICLLVQILLGLCSGVADVFNTMYTKTFAPIYLLVSAVIFIGSILFVSFPLSVSLSRYFIIDAKKKSQVNELLYGYKNNFGNIVSIMFFKYIYIFLWSLLFIVPGIIKNYSYFIIEFILAENPNISRKRAFEISRTAMNGYKGKAFLLGLSFIGYIILSIITLGAGFIFLQPYMTAAYTQFYFEVKQNAIEKGYIDENELSTTESYYN